MYRGTNVPGNKCPWEQMSRGTNVLREQMSQEQKSWEQMSWGTNVLGTYVFWDQMSLEDRSLRTKAREQKSGDQMSRGTNVKHPIELPYPRL